MKSKFLKIASMLTIILLVSTVFNFKTSNAVETIPNYNVDLTNLTITSNGTKSELKTYTQDDFQTFLSDYNTKSLPAVYVTEFLFDGVGMVKSYDLDDFIESGNDVKVKTLSVKAFNINTTGSVEFTGEITGGMIAVNTNDVSGDINIVLNNAKIDTDSKKVPAIYVYNKDITYTGCKVTIKTAQNSKNYIEGGKFKKVSLVGSDELSNYTSKYSGDNQTNYTTYTNYYGVYTSAQISDILFAKVQADSDDLKDGDPYYFYKGAGAISSDIDLYFEGTGYLEVKSKNKEGIETKGNLTLSGGTGNYVVYAEDDCLNTTTKTSSGTSVRNALSIDVNSLYAIVDSGEDADEGDAIDSNGTLTINGGTIVALAHPGQDAGLDSENGTYINGGTIIATGDMLDPISNQSKQRFMTLSFSNKVSTDDLITLLNKDSKVIMAFKSDRTFTNLVYSSADLEDGAYYLYKGGEIAGDQTNGYYTNVSNYTKGTKQGYSSKGTQGGMMGGNMTGERPELPNGEVPSDMQGTNTANEQKRQPGQAGVDTTGERPELPNGLEPNDMNSEEMKTPDGKSLPNGLVAPDDMTPPDSMQNNPDDTTASNGEFVIEGISNQFSGVANYSGEDADDSSENQAQVVNENNKKISDVLSNNIAIVAIIAGAVVLVAAIVGIVIVMKKKK